MVLGTKQVSIPVYEYVIIYKKNGECHTEIFNSIDMITRQRASEIYGVSVTGIRVERNLQQIVLVNISGQTVEGIIAESAI